MWSSAGGRHCSGLITAGQLDIYPLPPSTRDDDRDPWPTWPWILRDYPAREEGGERVFAVAVQEFVGTGQLRAIRIAEVAVEKRHGQRIVTVVPDSERRSWPIWCCWRSASTVRNPGRCWTRPACAEPG